MTIFLSLRESPNPPADVRGLAAAWTIKRNPRFFARVLLHSSVEPGGAKWHTLRSEERVVIESVTGILRERSARRRSL